MIGIHQTQEVDYDDAEHRYFLQARIYKSSTQIVERFIKPFNTKEQSERMSDRYGQPPEYWVNKWKGINQIALKRGDIIHSSKEDFLHGRGYDAINGKIFRVINLLAPIHGNYRSNYSLLPDGVYPELKVWRHDWGIAGRIDKPIIETLDNGVRYAHIEDYKTGRKISQESYRDNKTGEYEMMLYPLHHLMSCEYNHYALQLSLYQFMLEYFGFKAGDRRIIHYAHRQEWHTEDPKPVPIPVPYMRNEVLMMLNHLKNDGWLK